MQGRMRSAPHDGGMMNTSLSDMLDGMELSPKAKSKESLTIATKDSIRKKASASAIKLSKRGAKKGMPGLEENSLEHSLSDLMNTKSYVKASPKESMSVFTTDSLGKKPKEGSTPKRSKRGGKRSENGDMERSLSDLLCDENERESTTNATGKARESLTVNTMDSIQREKMDGRKTSKRGGRKPTPSSSDGSSCKKMSTTLSSTLGKLGGPPKDFGRHADDNDTFCDAPTSKMAAPPSTLRGSGKLTSPFGPTNEDTSDSDDDEDLFASFSGGSNPFRLPTYL
jgi:hypothetical protein